MKQLPLEGIRVIDFTWVLAGPYATRILADFGAEVIKIQSGKTDRGTELNNTHEFATWNRNKLGITLNMNKPEARKMALDLIKVSDVIVQNFSPRVMENWDLDYKVIRQVNPAVIMANLSGMGTDGPWRNYVTLADTVEALSGLTFLTSAMQSSCSIIGFAYADIVAGLFLVLAILSALEIRHKTGQGQYVDISEFETTCALLGPAILDYAVNRKIPVPGMNDSGYVNAAPHGCFKCIDEDKWFVVAVYTDEQWHQLYRIMGKPEWIKSSKFSSFEGRKKYSKALNRHIQEWASAEKAGNIVSMLRKSHIPCGVVNNIRDVANDVQLRSRAFFPVMHHPVLGEITMDGMPLKLSRTPYALRKTSPLFGQDNDYVFKNLLGLSDKSISRYIQKGIIG